jgi:hypothetical protein
MNKTVTMVILLVVILLSLGLYVINTLPSKDTEADAGAGIENSSGDSPASDIQKYLDPEIGLSFTYAGGHAGYVLDSLQGSGTDHIKTLRLVTIEDSALMNDGGAHDGPPAILIQAFLRESQDGPEAWAREHAAASNLNLIIGEVGKTQIGGADAIRYTIDGLYPTDTVVVLNGKFAYVISGSYLDADSPTKRDFDPLLKSVAFIPSED